MPNLGVPLTNPDGTAGLIWYRFFVSLFNAALAGDPSAGVTPSNPPGLTVSSLNQSLQSEVAARSAADASLQAQITGLQSGSSSLQGQINALAARVASLEARLDNASIGALSPTATAGVGGPLPLQVNTYLTMVVSAVTYRVPLYNP